MSYKVIKNIFDRLPSPEKKMPIAVIDKKVFTWEDALAEIKKKGPLADRIQEKIEKMIE